MSAPLEQLDIRAPGVFGLNTESELAVADPRWLTEGRNLVFDERGRIAARKGISILTTSGQFDTPLVSIHEYIKDATTSEIICSADSMLGIGTTTISNITGILAPANSDWQFVNFNGKCVAVAQGETPIVYTGTGDFADISAASGTLPTGNCALSAFGRLWIADADKTTLKFSATLDETHWTTGAGSLDTLEIWPDGIDTIQAVAEFANQLLIFGTRSILIYSNPADPTDAAFALYDIINRGTKWRDSLVAVGNDLLFMSDDGLHSVARGLDSQTMPLIDLTSHLRTTLVMQLATAETVKSAYSPADKAILTRISTSTTVNSFWYFDLGQRLQDGDLRAFQWDSIGYTCIAVASDNTVYLGGNGTQGEVAQYTGYDDDGEAYSVEWLTAGTDFEIPGEKVLKSAQMLITSGADIALQVKWDTDFSADFQTAGTSISVFAGSEFSIAEWGLGEWSGGFAAFRLVKVPLSRSGQIIRLGAIATVNGGELAFSTVRILSKIGRLAA